MSSITTIILAMHSALHRADFHSTFFEYIDKFSQYGLNFYTSFKKYSIVKHSLVETVNFKDHKQIRKQYNVFIYYNQIFIFSL